MFAQAAALTAAERDAYLLEVCADDPALLAEVRSLLAAETAARGFLEPNRQELDPVAKLGPGDRVGPYLLGHELGAGGFGIVFQARGPDDAVVALKTVRATSATHLTSLRREIEALRRVAHPGCARILASGLAAGIPWYAMELIEGRSLRAVMDDLITPSPELPRPSLRDALLDTVGRLCVPLAHLHAAGVVHRDLKPSNVLVRPSGEPVIIDFGLVDRYLDGGREALSTMSAAGGTIAYMAPEQAVGGRVDARADLFALGCILYEILTGRRPYEARSLPELRRLHRMAPAAAPSTLAAAIAPELDALVERLLEREPGRRPGYALDVARLLERSGASRIAAPIALRLRPHLYRAGCRGRDPLIDELTTAIGRLARGHGGVILLEGESGCGKTHLLNEVARAARKRQVRVFGGECAPGPSEPLHGLREPLKAIADLCRGAAGLAARLLGDDGPLLATFEPAFAALPQVGDGSPPEGLHGDDARRQLWAALERVLTRLGDERPTIVVVDDLQWADDLTLGLIQRLAARETAMAVLVVASTRSEEPSDALARLGQSATVRRVGPLDAQAVAAMTSEMLALEAPPPALLDLLGRNCEGNPFYVAEYLRLAVDEGCLRRDVDGRWQVEDGELALSVPGAVRELVLRRIVGLEPTARSLLEQAATFGREVDANLLAAASELTEIGYLAALQSLVLHEIVQEHEGRVRCAHDKLREVAIDALDTDRARSLHRRAATTMATLHGDAVGHQAALGHHWDHAGDPERALPCYLRAAGHASEHAAVGEAVRLYRRYLDLAPAPSAPTVTARNELGSLLRLTGRPADALAEHQRALAEATASDDGPRIALSLLGCGAAETVTAPAAAAISYGLARDRFAAASDASGIARAELNLAMVDLLTGRPAEALARASTSSAALVRDVPSSRERTGLEANAQRIQGEACWLQGQTLPAGEHFAAALGLFRTIGARRQIGRLLGTLASLRLDAGQSAEAQQMYEEALAIHRELDDRRHIGLQLNNLGLLLYARGELDPGRNKIGEALALHRSSGDRRYAASALHGLAVIDIEDRRPERAIELADEAVTMHRELGDAGQEGYGLVLRATAERDLGRFDAARADYQAGLELLTRVGDLRIEALGLAGLAQLDAYCGAWEPASPRIARAIELQQAGGWRLELALSTVVSGHIALASAGQAQAMWDQATRILEELGFTAVSPLGQALARLARAISGTRDGEPLVNGYRRSDLPAKVQAAIGSTAQS